MRTAWIIAALVSAVAFVASAPLAAADLGVCQEAAGSLYCAGYSVDDRKGALCIGVAQDPFSGTYVVACGGDDYCNVYMDNSGASSCRNGSVYGPAGEVAYLGGSLLP